MHFSLIHAVMSVCLFGGGAPAVPECELSGVVHVVNPNGTTGNTDNIVVYVSDVPPGAMSPLPKSAYEIAQEQKRFVPGLLVVPTGTQVAFPNHDHIRHNVKSETIGRRFTLGESRDDMTGRKTFEKSGWVHIECNIHQNMGADVLVLNNLFYARPNLDGTYSLPALPGGREYEIVATEPNGGRHSQIVSCSGRRKLTFAVQARPPPRRRGCLSDYCPD